MIDYDRILRNDEKAVYRLRELFGNYGYRRFKTGKFEEYELYAENKDFLGEDGILTFTDARGKLMALKPDVTLSIAKMAEPLPGEVQKFCYDDEVYRLSGEYGDFREITQTGIECIGEMCIRDRSGSTYMPKEQLLESTVKLLDVGSEQVEECLVQMIFQGKLQTDTIEETPVVYLYGYYLAEQSVAWHLAQIKEAHIDPLPADLDNLIQDAEKNRSGGIHLSEEQRGAVRQALTENVCIITGGPGTGKTTIINTIVYILEQLDIKVALAAPTGRAAKRITETSGVEAMTIHRMLEYVYSEDEHEMNFGRNEENLSLIHI